MVFRLYQHNIDYTADGFYKSDDPTNSVKALKEGRLVIKTGLSLTRLTSTCYMHADIIQENNLTHTK